MVNKLISKTTGIFFLLVSITSYSQNVGINTTGATPDASAVLDLNTGNSGNKGFLPQKVALTSTTDAATISSPATGLLVYNTATAGTPPTNVVPGYYYNSRTPASPLWALFIYNSNGSTVSGSAPYFTHLAVTDAGPSVGAPTKGTTYTYTIPAGVYQVQVWIAGGGGGSGSDGVSTYNSGSNGGVVTGILDVIPGETLTIFAGAGGTGFTSNTGGYGGTGSYITGIRNGVTTLLAGAGGGGGGSTDSFGLTPGYGGGSSFTATYPSNGGNGSATGGAGGGNYVGYLRQALSFKGLNDVSGGLVSSSPGIYSANFTQLYGTSTTVYGSGGAGGSDGTAGVVVLYY